MQDRAAMCQGHDRDQQPSESLAERTAVEDGDSPAAAAPPKVVSLRDRRPATLSEALELGYQYVYTVFIVQRLVGACKRHGLKFLWLPALVLLAAWPLWLGLLLVAVRPSLAVYAPRSIAFFIGFSLLDALMLYAGYSAWTLCHRGADRVDAMLREEADRAAVGSFVAKRIAHSRQLLFPVITMAVGLGSLPFMTGALKAQLVPVSFASYVCLAWTLFLGGSVSYWLFFAPTAARVLYRQPSITLRWQDPASTPGIQLLAVFFGLSALLLLAGTVLVVILAFRLPGLEAPQLRTLLDVIFGFLALLSFRVGVESYLWLYVLIRRSRRRTLDCLDTSIGPIPSPADPAAIDQAASRVALYRAVSSAPPMPFGTTALVQYTATLFGVIIIYV